MSTTRSHTPTASVVICAYTEERWSELVEAAESARAQTYPPAETVVVIDYNEALLARARETIAGDGVVVVANTGPQGLSGAGTRGSPPARAPSWRSSMTTPPPIRTGCARS